MRIALVDAFPNRPLTAETEIAHRFKRAADRLGWQTARTVTSTDLSDFVPDLVLATHDYTPKLTAHPTIGLLWGPPCFTESDPVRVRNILSYDGHLVGSRPIHTWVCDLLFAADKKVPVLGPIYPTCHATDCRRLTDSPLRLFYAGTNWDHGRHGNLFHQLAGQVPLALAGPISGWHGLERHLLPPVPLDGVSMLDAIHQCGVALCLNRTEHNDAETPSARIFEAVTAGAVAIADDLPFMRALFGDAVLYVPTSGSLEDRVAHIAGHLRWVEAHRAIAAEMATAAHDLFLKRFSFDAILPPLLLPLQRDLAPSTPKRSVRPLPAEASAAPVVEIMVRIGGRPATMVSRCLQALAAQTHPAIAVTLIQYQEMAGVEALIDDFTPAFARLNCIQVQNNQVRSNALWAGLRACSADYIANCDDDDIIHPDHVASLLAVFHRRPDVGLAFSGTIRVEEEPGHYFDQENFSGPLAERIPEPRQLKFLEPFDRTRLWCHENFIQSNAWLLRRELLTEDVLVDPELDVGEDLYLYLMLSRRTDFATSFRPTAEWNWRSTMRDNASHGHERWIAARRRIALRTAFEPAAQATEPLRRALLEAETDRAARLRQVEELSRLLAESEADRAARLVSIEQLTAWLKESEADRAARLEVIHALEARLQILESGNPQL